MRKKLGKNDKDRRGLRERNDKQQTPQAPAEEKNIIRGKNVGKIDKDKDEAMRITV